MTPLRPSLLYSTLSLLWSQPLLQSPLFTALSKLYGPQPSLPPSVLSTSLCPLHIPMCPLRPSLAYTAVCLSPVRSSAVPYISSLFHLPTAKAPPKPSVLSTALLSPLSPSDPGLMSYLEEMVMFSVGIKGPHSGMVLVSKAGW
jgi:hypothetical protein